MAEWRRLQQLATDLDAPAPWTDALADLADPDW